MKLIYLGQELDAEKEHELFSTNEFGFNVIAVNLNDFGVIIFNNCTEVHHKFKNIFESIKDRIVFESDIHQTGCWFYTSKFEYVTIKLATKKEKNFINEFGDIF